MTENTIPHVYEQMKGKGRVYNLTRHDLIIRDDEKQQEFVIKGSDDSYINYYRSGTFEIVINGTEIDMLRSISDQDTYIVPRVIGNKILKEEHIHDFPMRVVGPCEVYSSCRSNDNRKIVTKRWVVYKDYTPPLPEIKFKDIFN